MTPAAVQRTDGNINRTRRIPLDQLGDSARDNDSMVQGDSGRDRNKQMDLRLF